HKWHQQDPVSAEERARNEAIFRIQGNRNPFVDCPEFVEAMGTFMKEEGVR
ncbi:MAG: endonuclease, partial [Bacteroidota bacterium]